MSILSPILFRFYWSATIIVVGWFVNGLLNRRHEIAKKRMEYRLETLHSFLPVFFSIQKHENPFEDDPELLEKLEKSRSNFQLYGKTDEIELFESMIKGIESRDIPVFMSKLGKLIELDKYLGRKRPSFQNKPNCFAWFSLPSSTTSCS